MPFKDAARRREAAREWRKNNKDKTSAARRKYYLSHREELAERARVYRENNREDMNKKNRQKRIQDPDRFRLYELNRARTVVGRLRIMYKGARKRIRLKHSYKNRSIDFSLKELVARFASDKSYLKLFQAWVESGYKYSLCPSIDRIDNARGYSLDNIQIITLAENSRKLRKKKIAML